MFQGQPEPQENLADPKAKFGHLTGMAKGWANLRPPKKGEPSRNPRGRPKKDLSLAALAQKHAEDAIKTLASVMMNEDAPPNARVSAASEILDRGFGRAPQSLNVTGKIEFSDQFEAYIRSLNAGAGAKQIDCSTEPVEEAVVVEPDCDVSRETSGEYLGMDGQG